MPFVEFTNVSDQRTRINPDLVAAIVDYGEYVIVYMTGVESGFTIRASFAQVSQEIERHQHGSAVRDLTNDLLGRSR